LFLSFFCHTALCDIRPGEEMGASAGASDQRPRLLVRAFPIGALGLLLLRVPILHLLTPGHLQSPLLAQEGRIGTTRSPGLSIPQACFTCDLLCSFAHLKLPLSLSFLLVDGGVMCWVGEGEAGTVPAHGGPTSCFPPPDPSPHSAPNCPLGSCPRTVGSCHKAQGLTCLILS
jgi:hypothetical protein